jgi:hypothetical protein
MMNALASFIRELEDRGYLEFEILKMMTTVLQIDS